MRLWAKGGRLGAESGAGACCKIKLAIRRKDGKIVEPSLVVMFRLGIPSLISTSPLCGISLLLLLTSCGAGSDFGESSSTGGSVGPRVSVLASSLPTPYNSLPAPAEGGACSVDLAPSQSADQLGVSGWAIVDAKNGDVPDQIFLKVESFGRLQYASPERTERPDVSAYFKNKKLSSSGFVKVLPVPRSSRPVKISAIMAFRDALYECATSLTVNS